MSALFAVRRVLQLNLNSSIRLRSRPLGMRALQTTGRVWAVSERKTPSAVASASRHPFAESGGGGAKSATPGKPAKSKPPEGPGDPNDPGSRPKIGPFSKPVDTSPAEAPEKPVSSPMPDSADRQAEAEGEDHHAHPELRTRTGPHSSPVDDPPPPPVSAPEPPVPAPAPPKAKAVVKAPATGPSSTPERAAEAEGPEHLAIPPLPPPSTRGPAHQFDTYAFVRTLESSAVAEAPARALMQGVRGMLDSRSGRAREAMLSRQEMDNQAYRFKAALSALRTEISIKARLDSLAMRAASTAMQREVEGLDRRMTEDLQALRHDIDLELNTRKDDTRALMKRFDIDTEGLNNKFTISLGELRTEIESAKWEATRRAIAIIITLVICGVAISTFTSTLTPPAPPPVVPPVESTVTEKPKYKDAGVGEDSHFDDDLESLHDQLDELLDKEWPPAEKQEKVVEKKKAAFPDRI